MSNLDQPDLFAPTGGKRTTVYLGWDRPLCEAAADHLAAGWTSGTLDLTELLVLVPTRQSGRNLRETLARKISAAGGAVFPPLVTTPDALASLGIADSGTAGLAGTADVLKSWIDVLTSIDLTTFSALFPVAPPERSFNWALHTSADLINLRQELGENGLLITDAAQAMREEGIEPDRWNDLSRLESKVVARLKQAGLRDPQTARREAAESSKILPGVNRIVLLGTPDPSPLAVRILDNYSQSIPVEIAIYAPGSLAGLFDSWGRPDQARWNQRTVEIPEPTATIAVAANPRAQADETSRRISYLDQPAGVAAIGIGDPEVIPHLRQSLGDVGVGTYDPSGKPAIEHAVVSVIRHLRDLLESGSIPAFVNLLRSADILDALGDEAAESSKKSGTEPTFNPIALLRRLDDFTNRHLPDTLHDLASAITANPRGSTDIQFALDIFLIWLDRLAKRDFGTAFPEFLGWAFSAREFRADRPDDASTTEVARLVTAALDSMDGEIFTSQFELAPKDRLDLLLQLVSTARLTTDRRPDDIQLQGWLELLWEDAPHLVLTGFNEGMIPEAIVGDHYLPDAARTLLGLRDNDARLARDAYLLTAIIESRRTAGHVDILVGGTSNSGDPLRPSRLLFRCPLPELPARALHLFRTPESDGKSLPAREFPWKLNPPPPSADETQLEKISVTAFASYLQCPFRFYLSHNLGMGEVEVGKMEMNHADFGNVIHEIFRRFGEDATMRDCEKPETITDFLLDQATQIAGKRFGQNLPVPVLIQFESIRQRLRWFAEEQAEIRRDGWRIEHVEWKIGDDESPWEIDGFRVTGTIDRIDRHVTNGARMVIDYKTGTALDPETNHLVPPGEGDVQLHEWEISDDIKGNPKRWKNLQLPLYVLAARDRLEIGSVIRLETGYFNIPKARTGCQLKLWESLSESTLTDALTCARGVIAQIRSQIYWPPRDIKSPYGDFPSLLFGQPEKAINSTIFQK